MAQAATEFHPGNEYRPTTEWAKNFQRLATYPPPARVRYLHLWRGDAVQTQERLPQRPL